MNKSKKISKIPTNTSVIHSEKGEGFFNFFKEQTKKVMDSQFRVQIATSPFVVTKEYINNYDEIDWKASNHTLKKNL